MKMTIKSMPLLLLAMWSTCAAQTSSSKTEVTQSHSESSSGFHRNSTSVTTTSDGKTTVKTTVTVIDGVKTVVVETTDENGEVTRTESGGSPSEEVSSPWLGLWVEEVPKILRDQLDLSDDEGLAVKLVADGSPAMESGIQAGDLLLKLGDDSVSSQEDLSESLLKHQVGEEIALTVMRKAKRIDFKAKLAPAPEGEQREVPESLRQKLKKSSVESVDVKVTGEGFESLLNNPDLPESFKETIREMQKNLREFEEKTERMKPRD